MMKEKNKDFWKKFILKPGGLVDSVTEIDEFLNKSGMVDSDHKLKLFIQNIATYFYENHILLCEVTEKEIDNCTKIISNLLTTKEILTPIDFIIRILVSLLDETTQDDETNFLTTQNQEITDPKIKKLASEFLSKKQDGQTKLDDKIIQLHQQGLKIITQETLANRKNLSNSMSLRYV